jgi:hypothetical protein
MRTYDTSGKDLKYMHKILKNPTKLPDWDEILDAATEVCEYNGYPATEDNIVCLSQDYLRTYFPGQSELEN